MSKQKILFLDRDGTLIDEPEDKQVDSIDKLMFLPDVIPSLLKLKKAGYSFVMVSNQDGLGTTRFLQKNFECVQELMLRIFYSQGVDFIDVLICPHTASQGCECRKPKLGLVMNYLREQKIDTACSYMIGDRETDMQFAKNMGIEGIRIQQGVFSWTNISEYILSQPRSATLMRKTQETSINVKINLDDEGQTAIGTGIGFFDHMLEQLAKHAGISLSLEAKGDLVIDDHHLVEDVAIVLGEVLRKALGDKRGIGRYGFLLPMDESLSQVAIDLSGRSYFSFRGEFKRENVGGLSTELIPHFFRSFAEGLKATLHIEVTGENTHHMIESIFKCVGRALRQAIAKIDNTLPSTKGIL